MTVSYWEPDQLPQTLSTDERIGHASSSCARIVHRHNRNRVRESSGGRQNAAIGLGRNGFRMRIRTIARTHLALTSSRPGHTRVSSSAGTKRIRRPTAIRRTHTPLVGASALHGVSRRSSRSHLGSTLRPGGAVLTRGVSRRSGSVAYIRADASPTEVLASSSWHRNPVSVKQCSKNLYISADQAVPELTSRHCRV
jgi:hypothetical protein